MSWIKFKENYLFSINFAIMLSLLLYGVRRDFKWHPLIAILLILCLVSPKAREIQFKFFHFVGKVNSTIFLSAFYLLFFTPFSLIYKMAFRSKAFVKSDSRFTPKDAISDFDSPF